ncbi:MAG: hypothetical protein JXB50_08005 [Spirochaetes bacterium]|nr:hypothetical protein [Spirochaetota bacterium]
MEKLIKLPNESDWEYEYRENIINISNQVSKYLNMNKQGNTINDFKIMKNGIKKQYDNLLILNVPEKYKISYGHLKEALEYYIEGYEILVGLDLKDDKNSQKIIEVGKFIEIGTCFTKISSFEYLRTLKRN